MDRLGMKRERAYIDHKPIPMMSHIILSPFFKITTLVDLIFKWERRQDTVRPHMLGDKWGDMDGGFCLESK